MKKSDNNMVKNIETSKINSTITIDKKLDKIKDISFVSNKMEEANKIIRKLELSF